MGVEALDEEIEMEYRTRDMGIASYLLMEKYEFLKVEDQGKVKFWVFDIGEEKAEEVERKWFNSESKDFFQAFRELKNTLGTRW